MLQKRPPTEARLANELLRILRERLPATWSVERPNNETTSIDLILNVGAKAGSTVILAIEAKHAVEPRSIEGAVRQIRSLIAAHELDARPVVAAPYLSPRSRQLLVEAGVGYVDTTGNVRIEAASPDLFILTQGANKDPWPQDKDLQSFRGRGAARSLRAVIDTAPPFGVRKIAGETASSPATMSRVFELLESEGLIKRRPRGPVEHVDWDQAIRRWAQDYDQLASNTATTYLSPRGLPFVETELKNSELTYAATGAFAAQKFDPVAPARTATIYVDDFVATADQLELRETDAGANVVLLEPFDPVVFDRTLDREGLRCVAPSQLAVDLLTGPGREPSQGAQILDWMKENQDVWRT